MGARAAAGDRSAAALRAAGAVAGGRGYIRHPERSAQQRIPGPDAPGTGGQLRRPGPAPRSGPDPETDRSVGGSVGGRGPGGSRRRFGSRSYPNPPPPPSRGPGRPSWHRPRLHSPGWTTPISPSPSPTARRRCRFFAGPPHRMATGAGTTSSPSTCGRSTATKRRPPSSPGLATSPDTDRSTRLAATSSTQSRAATPPPTSPARWSSPPGSGSFT